MTAIDKKFYNLFWTNPICQTIFSNHKTQLLEGEVELIITKEKFFAKRLVLTNSQKRKSGHQALKRTENENIELVFKLNQAAKKYFDEERLEAFFKEKFGRTISKVHKDLKKSGGWLTLVIKLITSLNDEKDLFDLLSDYHLIPKGIEDMDQLVKHCETVFTGQMKEFLKKENLSDLAITIDLISTYYNHKIKNNLLDSTKHYTDLLYDQENYSSRLEFFDELFEIKVIKGGTLKSYYECVNCPPNTFNGTLTIDIKPSKLKLKCPSCNKEVLYIVPYLLDDLIHKHIVHKDGLLLFAIQHLLDKADHKYQVNQNFLQDVEVDFCLLNEQNQIYEIIEVKMFKTDRPDDTQVGNLRQAVAQVKDIINKLAIVDLGFKNIKYSIVTNIISDSVYSVAKRELEGELRANNISIYSVTDFYTRMTK